MLIKYNQDGSLNYIDGSNIFRKSNKVNNVDMSINLPLDSVVLISLVQDDGTPVPAKQCLPEQLEDGSYIWRYSLDDYDLRLDGGLKISYEINYVNSENSLTTEIVNAIVQNSNANGVEPVEPSTTEEIFENIAKLAAAKQDKFDYNIKVIGGSNKVVDSLNILDTNKQNKTDNNLTTQSKDIVGSINELNREKQNKVDDTLVGETKNVVEAINSNTNNVSLLKQQVTTNTQNISKNSQDISFLKQNMTTGETQIGTITTQDVVATDEKLNEFVVNTVQRNPRNGDSVYNIVHIENETDKTYRCVFGADGWSKLEIPTIESAGNNNLGIIKGTYSTDSTRNILVSIIGGEIVDILIKNNNNEYLSIFNYINQNKTEIDANLSSINNIINGSQSVGNSLKLNNKVESQLNVMSASLLNGKDESELNVATSQRATQDSVGNNINEYYAPLGAVYTKQQSDARFLSKSFGALWYISTNGLVLEPPTEPPTGIQFENTFTTAGIEQLFFNLDHSIIGDLEFNSATACEMLPKLAFSRNSNLIVKVNYFVKKQADADFTQIGVVVSDELSVNGSDSYPIVTIPNLKTNFSLIPLGTFIDLKPGDTLRIQMYLTFDSSESISVRLYSDETYPSTYRLALDNTVVLESNTGAVAVIINESAWTYNSADEIYTASIAQNMHHITPTYDLIVLGRVMTSAEVYEDIDLANSTDSSGNITLYSTTPLNLYVLIAGGAYKNGGVE